MSAISVSIYFRRITRGIHLTDYISIVENAALLEIYEILDALLNHGDAQNSLTIVQGHLRWEMSGNTTSINVYCKYWLQSLNVIRGVGPKNF